MLDFIEYMAGLDIGSFVIFAGLVIAYFVVLTCMIIQLVREVE